RKEQKAQERKKTLIFGGIALLIVAVLVGIPVLSIVNKNKKDNRAFDQLGVPVGLAACDATAQTDKVGADDGNHETDPTVRIDYATAPPSHGRHFATPITVNARGFYTPDDVPRVEELVHNLEHGYTIVWYLPSVSGTQLDDLKSLAKKMHAANDTRKFIVVPWDTSRGAFPAGKTVAMTHWGAPKTAGKYETSTGYRQYCGQVSGAAIKTFVDQHPATDAPEPNTA
ncbi:MAG TPA: DUF3105 domain-containing protein, partial [Sporichthya sp.]|nr:DUF3105 domain-containing protein [Sporichthya sp.]